MNTHFVSKRLAHQLSIAGLVPFIALSFACWGASIEWMGVFIRAQLAYGILVLAFLGAIHWGAALASARVSCSQTRSALVWSIVPVLVAWLATMTGGFGFAVMIAGFICAYLVDRRLYAWYPMPEWLIRLRFVLTCVVVAALALTVIAANVRG
jgi:hypothetical protein